MTREIPAPLRAAAGLAAVAVDEARRLPNRLASLPVVALGAALQASMRMQQRYAELVGRGDELLSGMRQPAEQPPWARFDEDEPSPNGRVEGYRPDADGWAFADEEITELAEDPAAYDEYVAAEDGQDTEPAVELRLAPEASLVEDVDVDAALAVPDAENVPEVGHAGGPAIVVPVPAASVGAAVESAAEAALPLAGYDRLSLPQLRARLSRLSADDLAALLEYERHHAARAPYLTMLENRLHRVRRP